MQDSDRKLTALAYALGWTAVIMLVWVLAGWVVYLGWVTGRFRLFPDAWMPSPEVYLIFLGIAKLLAVGLILAWIAVLLYRRRLR
jgi:hypothetical protein